MTRTGSIAAIAAIAVGLTACNSNDSDTGMQGKSTMSQGTSQTDPANAGQDPSSPADAVVTTALGEGQLPPGVPSTYYADMAELAEVDQIDSPPDVQPIRAVSPDDIDQVMANCMTESGFPAQVEPNGGFSYGGSIEQEEAAILAEYVCQGQYPLAEIYTQPLSSEQLQIYYDWMVQETIPCMTDLGYPTPEPPSFKTFVAGYEAEKTLFFPDTALDPATIAGDMNTIMASCEVLPPTDLLYGTG